MTPSGRGEIRIDCASFAVARLGSENVGRTEGSSLCANDDFTVYPAGDRVPTDRPTDDRPAGRSHRYAGPDRCILRVRDLARVDLSVAPAAVSTRPARAGSLRGRTHVF